MIRDIIQFFEDAHINEVTETLKYYDMDFYNQYTECPACGKETFNENKGICRNEECCYEDEVDDE